MQTEQQKKKRRIASAIGAGVLTVAIAVTGTYAWQSISQNAKNVVDVDNNPGGRLHDYFNGENKDIFVENFTDPDKNGVPIFIRVRLDEYMEIGPNAGKTNKTPVEAEDTPPLIAGTDINDVNTWTTHIPDNSSEICAGGDLDTFHNYWGWDMGGQTVFMPTFNKNKDSLKADINGTVEGLDGVKGEGVPYDDYVKYTVGETKTANAVYDADDNTVDEGDDAAEGTNINTMAEEHIAKATQTAQVMTMKQWKDLGSPMGSFWVYDIDGWAYWAEGLEAGEATGLLLNGINLNREPDNKAYYGINVVGQFTTRGDWGTPESNTGFYAENAGAPPTEDALFLLKQAADLLPSVTGISITEGKNIYIKPGDTVALHANVNVRNATHAPEETEVSWSINPEVNETVFKDGAFAPNDSMEGRIFQITATSTFNTAFSTSTNIYVYPKEAASVDKGKDGKMYVNYGDNTFKEILENGTLGEFICAGRDEKIGNVDDNTQVVTVTPADETYGGKFIGPDESDGGYWSAGPDNKLGTQDDVKVWGNDWPNDISTIPTNIAKIKKITPGSTQTTNIDGIDWYVLAKNGDEYLIWSKEPVSSFGTNGGGAFGDTNIWDSSAIKSWMNSSFLENQLTALKKYTVETTVKTRSQVGETSFIESQNTVFLLSEADLFGTFNSTTALSDDYTFNGKQLQMNDALKQTSTGASWLWLRSPRLNTSCVAQVSRSNTLNIRNNDLSGGVRPAMWVKIS